MTDSTNAIQANLVDSLNNRKAKIGVVGLGYVGLPLVLRYMEAGYKVIGIDVDQSRVDRINKGQSYIRHIAAQRIGQAIANGTEATSDFNRATEADALILCVPTPLNRYREPDLSFVTNTIDSLVPYLREGQIISLESTTYPGTTEEVLAPRIESGDLEVGKNVFLVYSPEREDPSNPDFDTRSIPKVCGGHTANCLEAGIALYQSAIDHVVPVSSTKVAEMTKLLENIHRAVNIGLVNEMKVVADKMGINIYEVIEAAKTKPFGFTPYYPGPGLGGHCIPIDPFYLTWKAREYGLNTRFIELAGEVNTAMPRWVISKTMDALNNNDRALNKAKVLVLGIAYKKNVDDMRESASVVLMEMLEEKGAIVSYSDPHVPTFPKLRAHHFELDSVALSAESIASYDAVLLATDHDAFDFQMIRDNAKIVIDTRGKYASQPGKNIVNA